LIAYTIYHTFKYNKPNYEYMKKIVPYITRHDDSSQILAGLKIWPNKNNYGDISDAISKAIK